MGLSAEQDVVWLHCAQRIADTWASESRGQTWRGVSVSRSELYVAEVGQDSVDGLRRYLDKLVDTANAQAPRERQRRAGEERDRERFEQDAMARDARLTDQFRTPPT